MPDKLADKPGQTRTIKAAGAVAWRPGEDGQPEILLVHRKKYDDWSLPKGKTEPGESLPLTAVREVLEEGGARLALGRRLTPVRYKVSGRAKVVSYWAARVTGLEEGAVPNAEVDTIAWMTAERAKEKVTYAHDIGVLDEFAAVAADTQPLILLRHAQARPRADWRGDDMDRPLDDQGRADAAELASLLACFAPRAEILSSATVRCLDTVRPYAERIGAPVRAALELRASSRTTVAGSRGLLTTVVGAGTPVVICAHRENLPALMAGAAAAFGGSAPGVPGRDGSGRDGTGPGALAVPPAAEDPLPTAAFVVFHMSARALAAADRYELPGSLSRAGSLPGAGSLP
jgi:8-oxo-dGTP diphosphatase